MQVLPGSTANWDKPNRPNSFQTGPKLTTHNKMETTLKIINNK